MLQFNMFRDPQFIFIFTALYTIYSFYGLSQVRKYINSCNKEKVIPFKNSQIYAITVCLCSGFFTTFILVVSTIEFFYEYFRKNDDK